MLNQQVHVSHEGLANGLRRLHVKPHQAHNFWNDILDVRWKCDRQGIIHHEM
jgi:hypothetical protein